MAEKKTANSKGGAKPRKPARVPVVVNHEEQKTARKGRAAPAADAEHPPESAQNFEHVIRRTILERDRARSGR